MISDLTYELIPSGKGRHLIMLKKYTFSQTTKSSRYWSCSKKARLQCTARFKLDEGHNIISYHLEHNHEPPSLYRTSDGRYIKLENRNCF